MGLYDDVRTVDGHGQSAAPAIAATKPKVPAIPASIMAQRMGTMIQHRRVVAAAAVKPIPLIKTEAGGSGGGGIAGSTGLSSTTQLQSQLPQPTVVVKTEKVTSSPSSSLVASSDFDTAGGQGFQDDDDPYNPAEPNDYMQYCEERAEIQRRIERERDLKLLLEEQEKDRIKREKERSEIIKKIQEEAQNAKAEGRAMVMDDVAPTLGVAGGRGGGGGDGGGSGGIAGGPGGDMLAVGRGRGMGRGRGRGVSNLPAWMTAGKPANSADSDARTQSSQDGPRPTGPDDGRYDDASPASRKPSNTGERGESSSGGGGNDGTRSPPPPPLGSAASGMDFAASYMAKMGHKEGQGLGKGGRGISQPLVARGGSGGMGRIDMHKDDTKRVGFVGMEADSRGERAASSLQPQPPKKRGLFSNPTRVVLLKNMVGPGEVDEELEEETKEECSKYGPVKQCRIYELKEPGVKADEAVRIFVAFERQESAVKAFLDMSGRFFGGRQIAALFYDEDRFAKEDWRPRPDEAK